MAAPGWGNSPYPHPGRYPPNRSPYDPRRQQYFQPATPGFYNPAVFPNQQAYAPHTPTSAPPIPSILKPGRGPPVSPPVGGFRANSFSSELSGDIFFQNPSPPAFPQPQIQHIPPPQIRHTVSAPAPHIPRKPDFNQPPLPPKPSLSIQDGPGPSLYPQPVASTSLHDRSPRVPPKVLNPGSDKHTSSPNSDTDFNRALQQSAEADAEIRRQEEEDLARALEESLRTSPRRASSPLPPSLHIPIDDRSGFEHSPGSHESDHVTHPAYILTSTPFLTSPVSSPSAHAEGSSQRRDAKPDAVYNSPPRMDRQILDDEAFARSLLEEEQRAAKQAVEQGKAQTNQDSSSSSPLPPVEPGLPQYDNIVFPPHPLPATTPNSPSINSAPPMATHSYGQRTPESPQIPSPGPILGRSTSANVVPTYPVHDSETRNGRSLSFGASGTKSVARPPLNESSNEPSPQLKHKTSTAFPQPLPSVQEHSPSGSSQGSPQPPTESPPLIHRTSSQYIDNELLKGVTIGFGPPVVTTELVPMKGPIPNVIGLPYGRAPPLHMKAPNWRDMLKLMARLSSTRLEPTVEALALVKIPMQLRVVINFVKVHQLSTDWHVVLYMTIDLPIPSDHRYKQRNTSDPALLPYSYTLSPTPNFLRESADGPISKWYTIPSSENMPYPTLPITFPDLATYLMSALENSQRAINDRSSGLYRLAKSIGNFYPNQTDGEEDEEQRRGLLGRFFGRSNKPNRHSNDERSNLVTPFFADDFGR